jgi:hypothetical protein
MNLKIKNIFYLFVFIFINSIYSTNSIIENNIFDKNDDELTFTFQISNKKYPKPIAILKLISTFCALAGYTYTTWTAFDIFLKSWINHENEKARLLEISKNYNRRDITKLEWALSESFKQSVFPFFITSITKFLLSTPAFLYDVIKNKSKEKNKNEESKNEKMEFLLEEDSDLENIE